MTRLCSSNLWLNICIDNDSSRGSCNSSTCNIISSRRVLIWVGIVISEAFSLTEMIWFRLNSSWIIVDDIKCRTQEKYVQLSWKFNSLLSHEMSSLFQSYLPFSRKQVISACRPLSSVSQEKLLVRTSVRIMLREKQFLLKSAEIRLTYHLGSIYAKWLALNNFF